MIKKVKSGDIKIKNTEDSKGNVTMEINFTFPSLGKSVQASNLGKAVKKVLADKK